MGTLTVGTKTLHGIKRVPQWSHKGQQYNIGEKPTVTLYTYINHHVGTPNRTRLVIIQCFWTIIKSFRLRYGNNSIEKLSLKKRLVMVFRGQSRSTGHRCEGPQIYQGFTWTAGGTV